MWGGGGWREAVKLWVEAYTRLWYPPSPHIWKNKCIILSQKWSQIAEPKIYLLWLKGLTKTLGSFEVLLGGPGDNGVPLMVSTVNLECYNSCPLKPNRNKTAKIKQMETEPYFCGNQLVQKNCSFFVLGSEQPGQQPAQSRGRVCWAGMGRMPPPWAPSACTVPCAFPGLHTLHWQELSHWPFCSDFAPAVLLAASSLEILVFLGCSSKIPRGGSSTHTSLHEHSRAVALPWIQREPCAVLLPPSMTGKFL